MTPLLYSLDRGVSATVDAFRKFTDDQLVGAESALRLAAAAPRRDAGQRHSRELHEEVLTVGDERGLWMWPRRDKP